jgi:hypothetical protein
VIFPGPFPLLGRIEWCTDIRGHTAALSQAVGAVGFSKTYCSIIAGKFRKKSAENRMVYR